MSVDRNLQRARKGRRARSPPSCSSEQADGGQSCESMSIFSQNSGFRRAGLGTLAVPAAVTNHAPSPFAPPSACDSAGDADELLASKPRAPGRVAVGNRLEERDGTSLEERGATCDSTQSGGTRHCTHHGKTYRPRAFEASEDVSELMSL